MESAPGRTPRLDRRTALRLLAATGGTVAASTVISQPAFADCGSDLCRFGATGSVTASVRRVNVPLLADDFVVVTVSPISGDCGCGGAATFEYTAAYAVPGTYSGQISWQPNPSMSTQRLDLWPLWNAGTVTVAVGVRITCPGATAGSPPSIVCGYSNEVTLSVPAPGLWWSNEATSSIPISLTSCPATPPMGLPSCNQAGLFRSAGSDGYMVPGVQQPAADLEDRLAELRDTQSPVAQAGQPPEPPSTEPTDPAPTTTTMEPPNVERDRPETTTTSTIPETTEPSTTLE